MRSPVTVGQLAAVLARLDPNASVWLEGCDCVEQCAGVWLRPEGDGVEVWLVRVDTQDTNVVLEQ